MLRDIITMLGVIAGFTYYVMTVRHQNQSRGAQLFSEIYRDFKAEEVQTAFHDIMNKWKWDTYEEFAENYGSRNWEEWRKYMLIYSIYEGLGVLIYRNIIDVTMIEQLMRSYVVRFWEKMSPIIMESRERYGYTLMAEWTEYLYREVNQIESVPAYLIKTWPEMD